VHERRKKMKLVLKMWLNEQAKMMKRIKPCEQAMPDNLKGRWGYSDVK